MLMHSVFYDPKNDDATSSQALDDGRYEYFTPHDGIVCFFAGPSQTKKT
jgi:hypothetical protein